MLEKSIVVDTMTAKVGKYVDLHEFRYQIVSLTSVLSWDSEGTR